MELQETPEHLRRLVGEAEAAFGEVDWRASRGEGKWTRLELLGHLIDSAANNHQRFVRALERPRLDWPGYEQAADVAVQNYAGADPAECAALWAALNRHISHVIRQIPAEKVTTLCAIDGAPDLTLSDLVLDYVAHLEHHLRQILGDAAVSYSKLPWPPADANRQWPV